MKLLIRPVSSQDIEEVVQLSILAWEPVFSSFRQIMGSKIYSKIYPDWRKQQSEQIEAVCRDGERIIVWVAELDKVITGFIAYTLNMEAKTGEVEYLAVHPQYQNHGIGTWLNEFVLEKMKEVGIQLAEVGTGGDPAHAPARRSYEKAGYIALPQVRYYKYL